LASKEPPLQATQEGGRSDKQGRKRPSPQKKKGEGDVFASMNPGRGTGEIPGGVEKGKKLVPP